MRTFARIVTFALAAAMLFAAESSFAQKSDGTWPRVIENALATVTVYQPQIESFNDVTIEARAAVSVKAPKKEPVFGAVWFHARTTVDKQARIVTLDSTMVTQMKFPSATPEQEAWLKSVINAEIPNWGRTISYDVLVSQLANVEQEQAAGAKLNNAPPAIIYVTTPTVLIMIDGEPKYKDAEGGLKMVGNTPYFIVQDTASKLWYLKGRESWYSGQDVLGPWSAMTSSQPPQSVQTLAAKTVSTPPDSLKEQGKPTIPAVIVRTKPAEIIQTDGEPKFEPVKGTNLLYVKNSEDDIIMDIDSQQYYVLVAGRWYTTKSISGGPWAYVPGDQLPKDFPNIPAESDLADVRTSVPGTTEAKEAVLENSIPQTAAVDRKTAKLDVTYDGQPKFEAITGTKMSYAVNTDKSVLLIGGRRVRQRGGHRPPVQELPAPAVPREVPQGVGSAGREGAAAVRAPRGRREPGIATAGLRGAEPRHVHPPARLLEGADPVLVERERPRGGRPGAAVGARVRGRPDAQPARARGGFRRALAALGRGAPGLRLRFAMQAFNLMSTGWVMRSPHLHVIPPPSTWPWTQP